MTQALTETGHTVDTVAAELNVTQDAAHDFLSVRSVPAPAVYLRLRGLLGLNERADYLYIRVAAEAKPRERKRMSPHIPGVGAPNPLEAASVEALVTKLREVRDWAGRPSLRELETRTAGALRRSTISDMLRAKTLPRLETYTQFLQACMVPELDYWVVAWRKFAAAEAQAQAEVEATRGRPVPRAA